MNIHEYQAKALLRDYGAPVSDGRAVLKAEEAKTAASALPTEQEEPLTVTITPEGTVMLQTTEIATEQLVTRLRAVAAERESTRIFLRADGNVPYSIVMQVMGALNRGGLSNIGLVTDTGGPTLDEDG